MSRSRTTLCSGSRGGGGRRAGISEIVGGSGYQVRERSATTAFTAIPEGIRGVSYSEVARRVLLLLSLLV